MSERDAIGNMLAEEKLLSAEIERLDAVLSDIRSAFVSHLDGRNYLDELNPAGWHHCDIVVRIGGQDRHFEGDWLKNVWYALRRAEGFVPPAASMSADPENQAVDSAAKPNSGGDR